MRKINMVFHIQLVLVLNLLAGSGYAQDSNTANELSGSIQTSVENKSFTFHAQSMAPMRGGTRQLNPGYSLSVKGDTVICNLPYFGRVYQPSFGAADAGLNFTSTQFEYQTKIRKKGGWDVKIKTKDLTDQRQLNLTIFQNGTASVNIICSDRESIGFNGSLNVKQE